MAQPGPEDRLGRLEQSVRFWRRMTFALGIVVTVSVLGQGWLDYSGWRTTRTRRLEIVGDHGVVASISGEASGGLVTVYNVQGAPRLLMGASKQDSGQIEVHGKSGDRSALLWGTNSGGMLVLFNGAGNPVVDIQSNKLNNGVIAVNNVDGEYTTGMTGGRR